MGASSVMNPVLAGTASVLALDTSRLLDTFVEVRSTMLVIGADQRRACALKQFQRVPNAVQVPLLSLQVRNRQWISGQPLGIKTDPDTVFINVNRDRRMIRLLAAAIEQYCQAQQNREAQRGIAPGTW